MDFSSAPTSLDVKGSPNSPNSPESPDSPAASKTDTKKIVAIVVPVVVVVILLGGVAFFMWKRRARQIPQPPDEPIERPGQNGYSFGPNQGVVEYSGVSWEYPSELEGQQPYMLADSEMAGDGLAKRK